MELAAQIGSRLRGGETIELCSDLGGGKTSFVRGLVQGLGSQATVRSPSFTLMNEYRAPGSNKKLCHFDFYRLAEPGLIRDELREAIGDETNIIVVEWADLVEDILPTERLIISITVTGETARKFDFSYPIKYHYLFPANT